MPLNMITHRIDLNANWAMLLKPFFNIWRSLSHTRGYYPTPWRFRTSRRHCAFFRALSVLKIALDTV